MGQIDFHTIDIDFRPENEEQLQSWLANFLSTNGFEEYEINYIFTNDENILAINREHLQHDYYTDIITFDHSFEHGPLISDIYISVDTVHSNAVKHNEPVKRELHRVMVHGLLHLLGHQDKTDEQKAAMRRLEDDALRQLADAQ